MQVYLAIFIGGCIGSLARYGISIWIQPMHTFPFETLLVNLVGCFLLTFLLSNPVLAKKFSNSIRVGIGTGLIGSFTTFSTYAVETISLWNSEAFLLAITYVGISIIGGLLLSWLGFIVAHRRVKV